MLFVYLTLPGSGRDEARSIWDDDWLRLDLGQPRLDYRLIDIATVCGGFNLQKGPAWSDPLKYLGEPI